MSKVITRQDAQETGNFINFNTTHLVEKEFKSFLRHNCLKFGTFQCNAWLDPVTERLWSSDLHQQMAAESRHAAAVSKVECYVSRSTSAFASIIVCSCVIYATYMRMQVFTIKSVNHKFCEVIFKFTFLIFRTLSVFSFKFCDSMILCIYPQNSNFRFLPKT
jgi:hypothetical protein